jgi:7-cyano-7-deazaguanine synthase
MAIPQRESLDHASTGIPSTYVPSRNIIFLSIAASVAESRGAQAVYIAANSVDFSGYPDCTPEFITAFQKVLDVGTKAGKEGDGVTVEAPILTRSKAEIVKEAVRLKVPLELTWSCYKGGAKACGRCDSCLLRLEGFSKAGVKDPLEYEVIQ